MLPGITAHIVPGGALSYSDEILADTPVIFYQLEPLCIPLAANTCLTLDTSGNGLHAEAFNSGLVGGLTNPATGLVNVGTCYEFLGFVFGEPAGLVQNTNNELHLIGDMTVECWVDMDVFLSAESGTGPTYIAIEQRFSIIEAPADSDHNYLWSLTVSNTGLLGTHHQFGSRNNVFTESTHAITTGTTHHLVIVRDVTAKTITYFDNGVEFDTVVYSDNPTGGSETYMRISAKNGEGFPRLKGRLDEFAVYDYKLSAGRILSHYNAGI
jgi:hypothetical protein